MLFHVSIMSYKCLHEYNFINYYINLLSFFHSADGYLNYLYILKKIYMHKINISINFTKTFENEYALMRSSGFSVS
jgi:hypothetical protein